MLVLRVIKVSADVIVRPTITSSLIGGDLLETDRADTAVNWLSIDWLNHVHVVVRRPFALSVAGAVQQPRSLTTTSNGIERHVNDDKNSPGRRSSFMFFYITAADIELPVCTGRAKKEPLGKIRHLWNGSKLFRQIYTAYRGRLKPHILQINIAICCCIQN